MFGTARRADDDLSIKTVFDETAPFCAANQSGVVQDAEMMGDRHGGRLQSRGQVANIQRAGAQLIDDSQSNRIGKSLEGLGTVLGLPGACLHRATTEGIRRLDGTDDGRELLSDLTDYR